MGSTAGLLLLLLVVCVLDAAAQQRRDRQHYCQLSEKHQLCLERGPSELCGRLLVRGATPELRETIVAAHNVVRSQTARGKVRAKDGFLPQAADMLELVWDEELAAIAQEHAEQCVFDHDCAECRASVRFTAVGQNLALGYMVGTTNLKNRTVGLIRGWYQEVNMQQRSEISEYGDVSGTGHFTQMIWAETEAVGCGLLVQKQLGDLLTQVDLFCNYGVTGNVVGAPVYTPGDWCSRCAASTRCSARYPGLCAPL